ncbi:MAG: enoyl-CoA hydratase/isomerase family protein, partial [Acidimicrobiales bacterium]
FCGGYDLVEAHRAGTAGAESLIAEEGNFGALRGSPVPMVAALQGRVIGGGLELALAADVRIAAPDTVLAVPASTLGLVYSGAGLRLLVSALGESVARAMVLGGRVVPAGEAANLGVLSEVVPAPDQLRARALGVAVAIASWPAVATSNNRRALDVVTGRVAGDLGELRHASFASDGALAANIEAFVAGRGLPDVVAPRQHRPRRWRGWRGWRWRTWQWEPRRPLGSALPGRRRQHVRRSGSKITSGHAVSTYQEDHQ